MNYLLSACISTCVDLRNLIVVFISSVTPWPAPRPMSSCTRSLLKVPIACSSFHLTIYRIRVHYIISLFPRIPSSRPLELRLFGEVEVRMVTSLLILSVYFFFLGMITDEGCIRWGAMRPASTITIDSMQLEARSVMKLLPRHLSTKHGSKVRVILLSCVCV
jgi:hypothetical protein